MGFQLIFLHAICEGGVKLGTTILTTMSEKGKKKIEKLQRKRGFKTKKSNKYSKNEYYVGDPATLKIINDRLKSFRISTCLGRIARPIEDRNKWKASEWLLWIIFYVLICLKDLIPSKYLVNLGHLVNAVTICLEESITPGMLETAALSFEEFVKGFQTLYSEKAMNYNIHLLLHIPKTVENWGPLFSQTTFSFENENRLLLLNKKSNYKVVEEIVNRKLFYQHAPLFFRQKFMTDETTHFCNSMKFGKRLKNFTKTADGCILIGRGKIYSVQESETQILASMKIRNLEQFTIKSYNRIVYRGLRFTSTNYHCAKKTNNSCCETTNEFVIIRNILHLKNDNHERVIIFANPLRVERNLTFSDLQIRHIFHCKEQLEELKAYELTELLGPAVISIGKKKHYVLRVPKGCLSTEH